MERATSPRRYERIDPRTMTMHFCIGDEYHHGRYKIECLLESEFANEAEDSKLGPRFTLAVQLLRKRFMFMNTAHYALYAEKKRNIHNVSRPIVHAWIRKGLFVFE